MTTIAAHYSSGNVRDWKQAVTNVSNLYRDESVPTGQGDLSLVVNGFGIRFLSRHTPEADRTAGMVEAGVRVVACRNSMDRFGLGPDALIDGIEYVESGVAELVRLQGAGNVYLKLP